MPDMCTAADIPEARVFAPDQILFPDIFYKAFTYPGDEEALDTLRHVPGAPALLTYLQKTFTEGLIFLENNEQMIRVGPKNYSSLHKLVVRCAEILSCHVPEVYVTSNPVMDSSTKGHRRTCIVLSSGLVESLTADELSFVIGHELGHIKCGHGLYRQLGDILLQYWDVAASQIPLPGIGFVRYPLLGAYWEWYRRAELTCDRAGLLCLQETEPAMTALGKLAGKIAGFEGEFDIEASLEQSLSHEEVNHIVRIVSILHNAHNTHPFVPVRLREVREYSLSEEFKSILDGVYERDPLGLHEGGLRVRCECGTELNAKLKACPKCGRAIEIEPANGVSPAEVTCKACGSHWREDAKFCPECGNKRDHASGDGPLSVLAKLTPAFLKRS